MNEFYYYIIWCSEQSWSFSVAFVSFSHEESETQRPVRGHREIGARSAGSKSPAVSIYQVHSVLRGCREGPGWWVWERSRRNRKKVRAYQGQVWNNEARTGVKGAALLASAWPWQSRSVSLVWTKAKGAQTWKPADFYSVAFWIVWTPSRGSRIHRLKDELQSLALFLPPTCCVDHGQVIQHLSLYRSILSRKNVDNNSTYLMRLF